jgi:hypothetical protein
MSEVYDSFKSYANYTNAQKILIKKIIAFYKKTDCVSREDKPREDKPREDKPKEDKPKDGKPKDGTQKSKTDKDTKAILCDFYSKFSIKENPKNADLIDFEEKISNGTYGETYHSQKKLLDDVPLITKVQFVFDEKSINEIFVSFVIINSLLFQYNILERVLVPSYGIFLCSHRYKEIDNNAKKTRDQRQLVSICTNKNDPDPNIHIVQKFIKGNEFSEMIKKYTLKEFKNIIRIIFKTLCILEASKYNIYHNDLHSHNIIVDENGDPHIIDFGFATFQIEHNGKILQYNNHYESYNGSQRIKSGANDLFCLLNNCKNKTEKDSVKNYCNSIINKFIYSRLWERNGVFLQRDRDENYYIYSILRSREKVLDKDEREIVHRHNMMELEKITYSLILESL